ncbi:hypothetical protein IC608_05080 [Devosia sp. PTR5]|uniref:Uncharacterized protein n=1 Tax=Devosia oryzisoli TaxID=2774138 RepID=A0A927ISI0_9HYPH|nr:hypothetical protein [Devosia oryzisoli]MBD8064847.1 hypothetical protein [Devosia oryzisoli]
MIFLAWEIGAGAEMLSAPRLARSQLEQLQRQTGLTVFAGLQSDAAEEALAGPLIACATRKLDLHRGSGVKLVIALGIAYIMDKKTNVESPRDRYA